MRPSRARKTETPRYPLEINWNRLALPGLALLAAGFLAPLLLLVLYSVFRDGPHGQVVGDATTLDLEGFYLRFRRVTRHDEDRCQGGQSDDHRAAPNVANHDKPPDPL